MLEWDEKDAMRYLAEIFRTLNQDGRNFLNDKLLSGQDTPDFVNIEELKNLINHDK